MSVTHPEAERTLQQADLTTVIDQRRRETLAALRRAETTLDRRDLAERVAAAERNASPDDVSEDVVDDVLLTLHHVHLPKLADIGYVEYDGTRVVPRF